MVGVEAISQEKGHHHMRERYIKPVLLVDAVFRSLKCRHQNDSLSDLGVVCLKLISLRLDINS